MDHRLTANDLDAYWMPFTPNRAYKAQPRMVARAEGMTYWTPDGREVLDGAAGLWCVNAGHSRPRIVEAIQRQAATLDFISPFNMGHPLAFEAARRVAGLFPDGLDHVFFTNSGSESVETALKIALAWHRLTGQGSRTRLIGRERGYHGVNFGGTSVGGIVRNRMYFGSLLTGVDHLPHTHDLARNAFSRGLPPHGADLADTLERIVGLHDASTIAAVIVEPVAGSAGVLIPPAGYLERLRRICDAHGILLIFDEVITGFGRIGAPFGVQCFGVQPDMVTIAKGLTNGAVPMGAVVVSKAIYDTFMTRADAPIELFHGYTYSGHPLACAAAIATLDTYAEEALFARAAAMAPVLEAAVHSLKDARHVIDIRNLGMVAAVEFEPRPGAPGKRAMEVYHRCFDAGVLVRATGDIIAISPPLIIEPAQIDRIVQTLRDVVAGVE